MKLPKSTLKRIKQINSNPHDYEDEREIYYTDSNVGKSLCPCGSGKSLSECCANLSSENIK